MKTVCLIDILEAKGYVEVKECERKDSTGVAGYFVEKYLAIETTFESVYNKVIEVCSNDEEVLLEQHSKSHRTFYVFIYQGEEAVNYIKRRAFISNSVISYNGLDKINKMVNPDYLVEPYSRFQHLVVNVLQEKEILRKKMEEKEFEEEVDNFIDSLP